MNKNTKLTLDFIALIALTVMALGALSWIFFIFRIYIALVFAGKAYEYFKVNNRHLDGKTVLFTLSALIIQPVISLGLGKAVLVIFEIFFIGLMIYEISKRIKER